MAGILIESPDRGFLPIRAFLLAKEKVPNPVRVNLLPFFNVFITEFVKELMTFSAEDLEMFASLAMLVMKSAFVIVVTSLFLGFFYANAGLKSLFFFIHLKNLISSSMAYRLS